MDILSKEADARMRESKARIEIMQHEADARMEQLQKETNSRMYNLIQQMKRSRTQSLPHISKRGQSGSLSAKVRGTYGQWKTIHLQSLFTGSFLDTFRESDSKSPEDYKAVKSSLLACFGITQPA